MSSLVAYLQQRLGFLQSCATSPGWDAEKQKKLSMRLLDEVTQKIVWVPHLDAVEGQAMLEAMRAAPLDGQAAAKLADIIQNHCMTARGSAQLASVHGSAQLASATSPDGPPRGSSQTALVGNCFQEHFFMHKYLPEVLWKQLLNPEPPVKEVLEARVEGLLAVCEGIGLIWPMQHVPAKVLYLATLQGDWTPELKKHALEYFKCGLRARSPFLSKEGVLRQFPCTPEELPKALYARAYSAAPPAPCPVTEASRIMLLQQFGNRITHKGLQLQQGHEPSILARAPSGSGFHGHGPAVAQSGWPTHIPGSGSPVFGSAGQACQPGWWPQGFPETQLGSAGPSPTPLGCAAPGVIPQHLLQFFPAGEGSQHVLRGPPGSTFNHTNGMLALAQTAVGDQTGCAFGVAGAAPSHVAQYWNRTPKEEGGLGHGRSPVPGSGDSPGDAASISPEPAASGCAGSAQPAAKRVRVTGKMTPPDGYGQDIAATGAMRGAASKRRAAVAAKKDLAKPVAKKTHTRKKAKKGSRGAARVVPGQTPAAHGKQLNKLAFPGVERNPGPLYFGTSTVYTDVRRRMWRLMPTSATRVLSQFQWRDDSEAAWARVVAELRTLNP